MPSWSRQHPLGTTWTENQALVSLEFECLRLIQPCLPIISVNHLRIGKNVWQFHAIFSIPVCPHALRAVNLVVEEGAVLQLDVSPPKALLNAHRQPPFVQSCGVWEHPWKLQ